MDKEEGLESHISVESTAEAAGRGGGGGGAKAAKCALSKRDFYVVDIPELAQPPQALSERQ